MTKWVFSAVKKCLHLDYGVVKAHRKTFNHILVDAIGGYNIKYLMRIGLSFFIFFYNNFIWVFKYTFSYSFSRTSHSMLVTTRHLWLSSDLIGDFKKLSPQKLNKSCDSTISISIVSLKTNHSMLVTAWHLWLSSDLNWWFEKLSPTKTK